MNHQQNSTNGLNLLLKNVQGFSQTQGAWRFYNNDNADIDSLNKPIISEGVEAINHQCDKYLLVAHDWSWIDYKNHNTKEESIQEKRSKSTQAKSKGYDLQSSLALSDRDGEPITPLVHNLKTHQNIYSTYDTTINTNATHLNELSSRIDYIHNKLTITKKIVHIIDREADSAGFMRSFEENEFFIIRANDRVTIKYQDKSMTQKELSQLIDLGKYVTTIGYKKQKVKIYVNSVEANVARDAYVKEMDAKGNVKQKRIQGESLKCRFVVERLVDEKGDVVATWLLLSNLNEDVADYTIALWYYYRWKIESYFKLLKSSGFNLEQWQQKSPIAIFKRLLVASYACLLVWRIEHSNYTKIVEIKKFLVKLSGRLVERNKVSTSPALLAGIYIFFTMMDTLELYDIDKLLSMKKELDSLLGFNV